MSTFTLLNAATTVAAGARVTMEHRDLRSATGKTVVQASALSGTGTATVRLEGQLDDIGWVPLVTFSLTASGSLVTDGAYVESLWKYLRANVTSNSSALPITVVIYREPGV